MTFSKKNQKPSSLKLVISSIIIASIAGVAYFSYTKKNEQNDGEKKEATTETANEIKSTGLDPDKDVSDVKDVEEVVAKWIEANPQAIINSVQNMQKKMMEEQTKNAQKNIGQKTSELFNDANSPQFAPEGYDVSVVEFYDYACGYCKKAQTTVDELLKSDSKVRIIYKDFPILGEPSQEMSRVSVAVNMIAPSSFRKFHDALMKTNERGKSAAVKAAKSAGVDSKKLEETLKTKKSEIDKILQDNVALGSSIGINGTPAFVIGEELIPGAMELASFKEKISALRAK
jgi:protein-disulfide isomerase